MKKRIKKKRRFYLKAKEGKVLPLVACVLFTLVAFAKTCWGSLHWMQTHRGPASEMLPSSTRLLSVLEGSLIPAFVTLLALVATLVYWSRHKRSIKKTFRSLGQKN